MKKEGVKNSRQKKIKKEFQTEKGYIQRHGGDPHSFVTYERLVNLAERLRGCGLKSGLPVLLC